MQEYSKTEYLKQAYGNDQKLKKKALQIALDIRKFEIDLYWKRANYFWLFNGTLMAGYFLVNKDFSSFQKELSYLLSCCGLAFSFAWYLTNRGSKYWQENWEFLVDVLEDDFIGPLYKSVLSKKSNSFFALNGAYHFSVSKINILLSFYVFIFWIIVIIRAFDFVPFLNYDFEIQNKIIYLLITIGFIISILCFGRSGLNDRRYYLKKVYFD